MRMRKKKNRKCSIGTYILSYSVMAFVMLVCLFPFVWLLISSFKTNMEILGGAFTWPQTPSFYGYKTAIEVSKIHLRYTTSITVAGISTILALFLYSMSAYVLARYKFKGRDIIFTILMLTLLIPSEATIQPIYKLINALGLYDTKTALILVYTAFAMCMCLFMLRSNFADIPKDLEEAAYVEGAGFFYTFIRIMLPLAKPALVSAGVLTFIGSWNELLYALLLTSSEKNRTLPLMLKYFTSSFSFNYPAMFAALIMYITPSIIIYILLQEQINTSMVAGAVKG
ncbi:MAG: carbohydrate ABC transporter permease [Christensenellales bacterium]|jgi:raffinose/stachyose/melibiose transport system permease protein